MQPKEKKYYLPCVTCPFCKEVVEAEVIETETTKTIFCPACKAKKEYPIESSEQK